MRLGACLWILALAWLMRYSQGASSGEITALSDLYHSCGGDNWTNNTNWLSGDPCSNSWYGVVCENGHVTGLYLQENRLEGPISASLDNLYEMDTLALYGNAISGSIPPEWSYIRTLVKLDIHENQFSGEIPQALGSLLEYNLAYLDFSDNSLQGQVPNFFNGAQNDFSYVNLSGNEFVCPIPSWAQYTQATCLECDLVSVQPFCTQPLEPVLLFGTNFNALSDVNCTIFDLDSGNMIGNTPAVVLSDSIIQCLVYQKFQNCSNTPGSRLYEMVVVSLSLYDQLLTTTGVEVGILNPYCEGHQVSGWKIPPVGVVEDICSISGNPTPWQCPVLPPGAPMEEAEFVIDCTTNSTETCLWTLATGSYDCPYYQCYTYGSYSCRSLSSYSSCQLNSSYYKGNCYPSYDECMANCH